MYITLFKRRELSKIYIDIVKESEQIIDRYFWIDKDEAFNLKEIVLRIKETSSFAIGEFEKLVRIKSSTKKQIAEVTNETKELLTSLNYGTYDSINEYVKALADIRKLRGKIVSLRDLRYTDTSVVDALEAEAKEKTKSFQISVLSF